MSLSLRTGRGGLTSTTEEDDDDDDDDDDDALFSFFLFGDPVALPSSLLSE